MGTYWNLRKFIIKPQEWDQRKAPVTVVQRNRESVKPPPSPSWKEEPADKVSVGCNVVTGQQARRKKWKKNHSHKQRQSIQQKQNHSNVVWLLYMENAQDVINQCVSASWATEFLGASLTQSWALKQLCMTQNCGKINPLKLTVSVCLFSLAAVNRPGQLVHGVSWKHAHQHTLSHHFTVPGKEAWRGCRNDVSSVDSRAIHDYSSVKRTHMHTLTHLHTLMICQRYFNTTWPTLLYSRIDVDINLSWREFHQRSIDSYFQWKGY